MSFPVASFEDILEGNAEFVRTRTPNSLTGRAARELAVITCIDSRIDPLGVLGLKPGDAKIVRNAGARVTEDVLRTLVLASALLNVTRVLVMPHTDCRMASGDEWQVHGQILEATGRDTRGIEIRTTTDQVGALAVDLMRIRSFPLLPDTLIAGGALYHVDTGELEIVEA